MMTPQSREIRREAWTETKKAVREYSKDPSAITETQVRAACRHLRAVCVQHPPVPGDDKAGKPELAPS